LLVKRAAAREPVVSVSALVDVVVEQTEDTSGIHEQKFLLFIWDFIHLFVQTILTTQYIY